MRKLWIAACLAGCSLAGNGLLAGDGLVPMIMSRQVPQAKQQQQRPMIVALIPQMVPSENFAPVVASHQVAPASVVKLAPPPVVEAPTQAPMQADAGYCDQCGGGRCRHGHHGRYDTGDRNASFHCGCNGSYKFPVPPLYTYHWPGMYSHQLMTDYHSPWRFPPIKPYVDELPMAEMGQSATSRRLQPVSATSEVRLPY